ncbi:hypothetical protein J5X84_39425 [Streptosporangiaceae bacterium NEAU-GS5]|nr:hypothetical protein [Streptosporangiaceae bacterium NEAU-GS5]
MKYEDVIRQGLVTARQDNEPIDDATAQAIASWLGEGVGRGFRLFLATGVASPQLYKELARLYDLRRPETESWLDALVIYCVRRPTRTRARNWRDGWEGRPGV